MHRVTACLVLSLSGLATVGCKGRDRATSPPPEQPTKTAVVAQAQPPIASAASKSADLAKTGPAGEAAQIYEQRCTMCHGKTGLGDGVAAANIDPKPRDYTDPKWQASVADDYLAKVIIQGGAGVARSNLMPGNSDLTGKAEVVAELVKIVRGFSKKN